MDLSIGTQAVSGRPPNTGEMIGRRRSVLIPWSVVMAAVVLMTATPVGMWWLIGDQTQIPAEMDPDYVVRPIEVDPVVEEAVGAGAAWAMFLALAWVSWVTIRHRSQRRWWSVVLLVLAAGYIIGVGLRAVTMGVIGANIGVVVLWSGPTIATLIAWAVVRAIDLLRSEAGHGSDGQP